MTDLKNGLICENNELIYYKDDKPYHAGVIKVDDSIYYINSEGKAVKGQYVVHKEMANGILERGTYTFGEDCKLIKGSYIAPRKKKRKKRRHTSRASARRTLRERFGGFWTKKKILRMVSVLVMILLLAATVSLVVKKVQGGDPAVSKETASTASRVKIVLPTFEEEVLLCSPAAKMEYDGEITLKAAVETGVPYRPFYFEYSLENTDGVLFVSENENMQDAREYLLEESEQYIAIDNLKVDTTYYYRVEADSREYLGSFRTAESTRFVSIPGLVNTRDIGGITNMDGKKIKQGLLIRGVELDGLVNAPYFIPDEELEGVQDTFGFVYDLDLRAASIYNDTYTSRLGVAHSFYTSPQYGQIFDRNWHASLKRIFSDMADPEKYPMYVHCTWGQDRTGTIIFLLQGILNVSEEDMKQEYWRTGYVNKVIAENSNMDVIIYGLEPYAGDTLQEKIVDFLITDVGVTEEEIASIRSVFLED